MFKGSYRFAKESLSKKSRQENVCEGATAVCGPPGHPCETCMHLKGLGPVDVNKDLCLIAPRSLVRPIQYRRYFNRGVTVPPYLPVSKVKGELKEVDVPEPCGPDVLQRMIREQEQRDCKFKFKDAAETTSPYVISNNVYLEHNGRFTKAPKHLLELGDYNTRVCYLEEFAGPEFDSPLDCAIMFQKAFTSFSKIAFGVLAGVALINITICFHLVPNAEEDDLSAFFNVYPQVCYIFYTTQSIFTIVCLLATFDWMDMGHMDFMHLWDTYLHRTIWVVMFPLFFAYVLYLFNGDLNNELYLHGADWTDYLIREVRETSIAENLPFRKALNFWEVRLLGVAALAVSSWILLVITRNDDLFLMHLECMKKFDFNPRKAEIKNESVHPKILPP